MDIPPELINSTVVAMEPFLKQFQAIMARAEIFIGGVFGLYFIFSVIRLVADRKNRKMLKEIKLELKKISERLEKMEQDKNSNRKAKNN